MIKYFSLAAAFCIMAATSSLSYANQHEQMMQQMMQMQRCIAENVDANYLEGLSQKAEAKSEEIKQMCLTGERDKAQKTAITYAQELQADANFKAMRKCIVDLGANFPSAQALQDDFDLDDLNKNHVCDDL